MKIGIITVYYTENCGSVLQATELSDKLKTLGHDVYFVSTRNGLSGHSKVRLVKNCIKAARSIKNVCSVIKKYISYDKYISSHFNTIDVQDISMLDGIIVGSDTVWDITSDYFRASKDVFWIKASEKLPIITYAASIANSDYDRLNSLPYVKETIESYSAVSVRDNYTFDYVSRFTAQCPVLVCDPTLLHDKTHYVAKCNIIHIPKYMLLYLFDEPDKNVADQIKKVAKEKGLKIIAMICLGKRISFADEWVESTIENFLSYFNQAECVVTNTFHGTVFSVIFNKQFLVLDYKKVKIIEFLNQVDLMSRLVTKVDFAILNKEIDYGAVNLKLANLRTLGEDFLRKYVRRDSFGK